jgi:hypothetical protein
MLQRISGYHRDFENHWVAELECGHAQHVRHDPPWTLREWVTTQEGRDAKINTELNCLRCDEVGSLVVKELIAKIKSAVLRGYQEAGLSGLCEEGRLEAALGSIDSLELKNILEDALRVKHE